MSYWGRPLYGEELDHWISLLTEREPDEVECGTHVCEETFKFPNAGIVITNIEGDYTIYTTEQHVKYRNDPHGFHDMVTNIQPKSSSKPILSGASLIMRERERQIYQEAFSPEADRSYTNYQLIAAAQTYIAVSHNDDFEAKHAAFIWPEDWDLKWFKPTNSVRNLVKAGALIAAEIDRLQYEELCQLENSNTSNSERL